MISYLLHKIGYAFFTLFGVVTVVFLLFNILPGDPARMMLGQNETAEQVAIVKKKYGFDQPLSKQYVYYLNDLSPISFHSLRKEDHSYFSDKKYLGLKLFSIGEINVVLKAPYLRESFQKNGKKVSTVILETLPNTIVLAISSIFIAMVLGMSLGVISAMYKDSLIDKLIQLVSTFGMSVPSFFSAILFAWFFGFLLHNYTGLNMTGSLYEVDDYGRGQTRVWSNLILPTITLGIRPLAVIMQLTRNSLLDILNEDYIRTAKAKGLSHTRVLFVHALPNALNPIITAASGWLASMLAGAVFIEYIFGWNGIGKEIVSALNFLDLPLVMGSVLTISACFIVITLLTDIIYYIIDPRIRN